MNKSFVILFPLDKNSGCYDNLQFFIDLFWEKWKLAIFAVSLGSFESLFIRNVYRVVN